MVLDGLKHSIAEAVRKLRRLPVIDREAIESFVSELRKSLIESDVNVDVAISMTENIKENAMKQRLSGGITREKMVVKLAHDELSKFLGRDPVPIRAKKGRETIMLVVGIQGSGKTTTVAKIARYYSKRNFKVGMVCTDTWRPGAHDQLVQLGDKIGVEVYGNPDETNALKLAMDGTDRFFNGKEKKDIVLIDTAGRHKEEESLMKEMNEMERMLKPDETILVVDGTIGQQASVQASRFAHTTSLGNIVVTKLDGTAKGGGALSACVTTGAKIRFVGTGEGMDDLEIFDPTRFAGELLGITDMKSIIEEVEGAGIDLEGSQKQLMTGKMTLVEFMDVLRQFKKIGNIGKILGAFSQNAQLPSNFNDVAKDQMKRWETIINSMTPEEKKEPKIIKGSRLTRIATGSGGTRSEIKALLSKFADVNKFMKRFGKGGMKGTRKNPLFRKFLGGSGLPT